MNRALIACAVLAALFISGCAQQAPAPQPDTSLNEGQITGMESDLAEIESSLDDSDFSEYEFLEVNESTFQ